MLPPAEIVADLQRRYSTFRTATTAADISRWTKNSAGDEERLFDNIGAEIARGYHEGRYSFEFCDQVVNDLHGAMIAENLFKEASSWPKLFDRVYEAFDAGEFHRKPDLSDDPVVEFTNPLIADIVRDL